MSLTKTFYLLKEAELRAGELYAAIGLSIAVTHPELHELFTELAEDEKMHCKQIELMQNIFMQSKDAFVENPEAEGLIATFVAGVETAKRFFYNKHLELKPADLLNLALDVERNLVEQHRTFFVKVTDSQIKQLFECLNLFDLAHIGKLEAYRPG